MSRRPSRGPELGRLRRFCSRHPRTLIALLVGIAGYFLLPHSWAFITRLLTAWDTGVLCFLGTIYIWMRRLSASQISAHYIEDDPSGPVLLVIVTATALLSLLATVELLATLRHVAHAQRFWHFVLVAVTLAGSWLLVPTMFMMHYADLFYSAAASERPLSFPQTPMPVFWDFAYFSFTISAASQTADVLTTQLGVRKVVIAHEIIAFFFNASVVGFAINVTAGLIGG
ncbi:MAG TPA: DUF1345 domain-containing protein [Steroidobacteraceae bacterium]|jgi:uncharacterized membrane protein|nr:DUF1345 domain-containing protein [Steroidobacteraceae bacterium]